LLHSLLTRVSLTHTAATDIYTLSLHDALPISNLTAALGYYRATLGGVGLDDSPEVTALQQAADGGAPPVPTLYLHGRTGGAPPRSEEHTSELQSRENLVCRLLLEKKKDDND